MRKGGRDSAAGSEGRRRHLGIAGLRCVAMMCLNIKRLKPLSDMIERLAFLCCCPKYLFRGDLLNYCWQELAVVELQQRYGISVRSVWKLVQKREGVSECGPSFAEI